MSTTTEKKTIPVGSGEIYVAKYTGTLPTDTVIETEENRLGYIEKGCKVVYKPTVKPFTDDLGYIKRTKLTAEDASMKLGLISWVYSKLAEICSTARVTESDTGRKILIGGLNKDDGYSYVFRFVHKDPAQGEVRVTIIGTNTAGFTLDYQPDSSTNIEPEITAMPSDSDGTLIIIDVKDAA